MDITWTMAIATGVFNGCAALAGKAAERGRCRPAAYALVAFAVAGSVACAATLGRDVAWNSGVLWLFGIIMGSLYLAAVPIMLSAYRHWTPSLVWGAVNMAFVMPILLSAPLLGEPLRPMDAAIALGVGLMLAGLAAGGATAPAGTGEPVASARRRWGLLAAVFIISGLLMFAFKLFGRVLPQAHPATLIAVVYGCAATLAAVRVGRGLTTLKRIEVGYGLGAGAASAGAGLAMLGAMHLPAATAFPVIQGVSLLSGVLLCAAVFRERITSRKAMALALGALALVLTRWR